MSEGRIRAFWNGEELTEERGYRAAPGWGWSPKEGSGPSLKPWFDSDGFHSVLARPEDSNLTLAMTLEESPEAGSYVFTPQREGYDFEVRLEFENGPFPAAQMQTLDLTTELRRAAPGDGIEVNLRKDTTNTPGLTRVSGTVLAMVDSAEAVPNFSQGAASASEYPVVSILIGMDERDGPSSSDYSAMPLLSHTLHPGGGTGKLDVVGWSEPLDLQWEGASDTPALLVESVTVKPRDADSWTIRNTTLPEVQFTPLRELSVSERVQVLHSAFDQSPAVQVPSDETLEALASAADGDSPQTHVTVRYDTSKSDEVQVRSGAVESVHSSYYAERNRACHRIDFIDTKLHYLLLDSSADSEAPVALYSKSHARHWDTELGEVRDVDFSAAKRGSDS
jgi:hypothetical protein